MLERLDDLLRAFRSLEIETLIIGTDFTVGTCRKISYPKSGKNHFPGTFTIKRRGDSFDQKVRLILTILQNW